MKINGLYLQYRKKGTYIMKLLVRTACQVVFFIAVARIADLLVDWLRLPIPGSILGIAILFALLKLGVVRLSWIDSGSKWLLGEMLLFFIPAAVGIINYGSLVVSSGWQIAITIIASTASVMACAGWVGERVAARAKRANSAKPANGANAGIVIGSEGSVQG